MSDQNKYTIGWICAISTELVAAQAFLDERHEGPTHVSSKDDNDYTLGKIGNHNIVIAVLPAGEYGTASAASVAKDMLHSFPNIRFGLMVGIGGGAPSKTNDIRLGDIVVSDPGNKSGGVFQYDFGKKIQGQSFRITGFLNQPPRLLRTAVNGLKAQYESDGHQLEDTINGILEKKPRLRKKYMRPSSITDKLYKSEVIHQHEGESCAASCGDGPSTVVSRSERTEEDDNPAIHYGLIASANELMKDALARDKWAAENNVLCFEMEAAGLMNHFPCLVIRGICDYSDTHKNKDWQGYAAMTAAAYAVDLLRRIVPTQVEDERKISEVLSDLQEVAETHRDIALKQLEIQQDTLKQKLSDKQQECLQLFRLTKSTEDATYEWFKDRVEDRIEHTCGWFLQHDHFKEWLKQESGPLLVSADPGCGKSVLAKYLIDHDLPKSATVCYFFFKDQDQNSVRQALCAILHQLLSQKPPLIQHAMELFVKDGKGLINSTKSLWAILENAVQDPQAGVVIIVLDALDECAESEFEDLMRNLEKLLHNNQSGRSKLKCLLTSRPYEQIVSKYRGLLDFSTRIHIPGEEESEIINQEVNYVIKHRVHRLAREKVLSDIVKDHLAEQLLKLTHRTYLWVHLVFKFLEAEDFKKTVKGVDAAMKTLPKSIDQAYEQILNKSKEHNMVRKVLGIILAACRPLTISEMNVAVNIENTSQFIHDLDLEEEADFKTRLRSWCGLFVSIHHGKIYFIHQTAREFLLADLRLSTDIPTEAQWYHFNTIHDAHTILAELSMRYLSLLNSDASFTTDKIREAGHHADSYALLDYSAEYWGFHFREARTSNEDIPIVSLALDISNPDSKIYLVWSRIHFNTVGLTNPAFSTSLLVASYFGHNAVATRLLDQSANLELKDNTYSQTPLSWAARYGHEAVVKLLLEKGADLESKDKDSRTPLLWAARYGHEAVVKLLLEKGAKQESKEKDSRTPLSWAARNGREAVVKLLLEKGADLESRDEDDRTPLSWAAEKGYEAVVKLLLEKGADLESRDKDSWTSLLGAARYGHEAVTKLLLEQSADVESKDKNSNTPLSWAARNGREVVVKLLLEKGANIESKDKDSWTPLSWASKNGHEVVVKLLLEKGADVETKGWDSRTPLSWAAEKGHEVVVKLLLEKGADVETKGKDSRTPLSWVARNGREAVTKLLLEKGADLESKSKDSRTPLSWAAERGHEVVVQLLLEKGADLESKDKDSWTPLSWASKNGQEAIVKLLLEKGADLESKDNDSRTPLLWAARYGYEVVVKLLLEKGADLEPKDDTYHQTPLSWATEKGHEAVVELLVNKGADLESKDKESRTPLWWAAYYGYEAIFKLLLEKGADLEFKDDTYNQTPLSWAAERGHKAVVKLLLEKGADLESKDKNGWTPLSWAARNGHEAVVKQLLNKGADLESKDNNNRTPLWRAAKNRHEVVVTLLLDMGADLESKDNNSQTPLSWAAKNGYEPAVKLLLEKGADLETKDKDSRTPLSWAAEKGYDAVVKLLEKGSFE